MMTRKKVQGEVQYNDGLFAEVKAVETERLEEGFLLDIIQLHREDTYDTD